MNTENHRLAENGEQTCKTCKAYFQNPPSCVHIMTLFLSTNENMTFKYYYSWEMVKYINELVEKG